MAFKKKEKAQPTKGANILNNPEERKKFKSMLAVLTKHMADIDLHRQSIKETVEDMAAEYGLDKKVINKLAKTMYKSNYGSLQEENNHFAMLYEILVEGKLRMDGEGEVTDPLDAEIDAEIEKAA
jgi:hypothetical protein